MHLRSILVGVKPSAPDWHPLWTAVELARRAGARCTVLTVNAPTPDSTIMPTPRGPTSAITSVGIPAIEIARTAEQRGANLIVLGRDLPNEREGAVMEGTVRRARMPCLVVPRGHCTFRRVLAAVDGGPDSEEVMTVARHIARLFEAPVRAIRVEAAVPVGVGASAWEPEPIAEGDQVLCHGDPVAEILRVVHDEDVGLLVFGHHRGGPARTHATSGVAPRLLQRARCAVLTVPI